jgi:hypothetical protein
VQESHEAADLATKGDIADLRHEMKELELHIDTRFEKVHGEMLLIKWMLGLLLQAWHHWFLSRFSALNPPAL